MPESDLPEMVRADYQAAREIARSDLKYGDGAYAARDLTLSTWFVEVQESDLPAKVRSADRARRRIAEQKEEHFPASRRSSKERLDSAIAMLKELHERARLPADGCSTSKDFASRLVIRNPSEEALRPPPDNSCAQSVEVPRSEDDISDEADAEDGHIDATLSRLQQLLAQLAQPPHPLEPPSAAAHSTNRNHDSSSQRHSSPPQRRKQQATPEARQSSPTESVPSAMQYHSAITHSQMLQGIATGTGTEPVNRLLIARLKPGRTRTLNQIIQNTCPERSHRPVSSEEWTLQCLDLIRYLAQRDGKLVEQPGEIPDRAEAKRWVEYAALRGSLSCPRRVGERVPVVDLTKGRKAIF